MKMKLLFLLVFLLMLTISIPTPGAMLPQEKDADQEQKFKDNEITNWIIDSIKGTLLESKYFSIKYSEDRKIPYWVAYHISTGNLKGKVRRTNDFRPDPRLSKGSVAELSDYEKSGYAKGHHVTPEAFKYDKDAMSKTFLLSTISPQNYKLNRNLWSALDKEIIYRAAKMGDAWVLSGNLFLDSGDNLTEPFEYIGSNLIAVPTHFFKVILFLHEKSRFSMEAYLIPNQRKISMKPKDHLIKVDQLEKITKYNFFPGLDIEIQKRLKSIEPYKRQK